MPFYLKIDFLRKSDERALTKGRSVKTLLASHSYCLDGPGAGVPDLLGSVIGRLQFATDDAKCRDVNKVRARAEIRGEFNNTFKNVARGIESWANGDISKMQNCGFDIRQTPNKKATALESLTAPTLTAFHGDVERVIVVNMGPVKGAAIWELQITTADPSLEENWAPYDRYATRNKILIPDRTPGQLYWLRGRVFGVAGYGPWSAPVSIRSL